MTADDKGVVETVQVALRIRPLVDSELQRGCEACLETFPGEPQIQVKGLAFTYNYVFPPDVNQRTFYSMAVEGLITKLFKGYNVTILAYGQTGSGKTYSMGTCYMGNQGTNYDAGVIPQAVGDIFDYMNETRDEFDFKVTVSFMELYQEQLYDLLSRKPREQSIIDIREDQRGIILPGLTEEKVTTVEGTMECLVRGSSGRATGATAMNATSSRSHAIFTIQITKESKLDKNMSTTSKFHLVDLAGSERSKKTKATGNRFKEGVKINQGLLALGNVISALGDGTNRGFINYRESKLTRLLQDSLGGNSLTLMVACVSPADYNLDETISTLRYADRAKQIRNKPIVNQDPKAAEIIRLNNLVQQLRLQILNNGEPLPQEQTDTTEELRMERLKYSALKEKYDNILEKNQKLNNMLQQSLTEHTTMFEKALLAEASKDKIERKLAEITEECNVTIDNLNKIADMSGGSSLRSDAVTSMCEIRSKILDLNSEQKQCSRLIVQLINDDQSDLKGETDTLEEYNTAETSPDLNESDFHDKQEAHAIEQVSRNNQLHDLVKSLALKISLAEKLSANNQELKTYSDSIQEYEARINELEMEKEKLLLLNKSKADHKDERRNRILDLENELSSLKKKLQRQPNLIKIKEKNELKINTLNNEIQQMKATKVKLIRSMRVENDRFRTWKLQNERQLAKLTNQDRKRQNAMLRMEDKHAKQQNVLKRKMEEAVATNKRLKEALDKQKLGQKHRGQQTTGKVEAVQHWVEQELELLGSLVAAERTLEGLLEDRGALATQLELLRAANPVSPAIAPLQDDINLRSAQIADLQQKILAGDQENKLKSRWDTVQTMVEAKCALKYLFEVTADTKREIYNHKYKNIQEDTKFEELKEAHDDAINRINEFEIERREIDYKHKKEISQVERQYEEKVSTLMYQLNNIKMEADGTISSKGIPILQDAFENALRAKDELQAENDRLLKKIDENSSKRKKKDTKKLVNMSMHWDEEDEEDEDSDDKDPDWRQTPILRRTFTKSRMTDSLSDETRMSVKRSSDGQTKCSCKGSCVKKVCSCRKMSMSCGDRCKCTEGLCLNRDTSDSENQPSQANQNFNTVDNNVSSKSTEEDEPDYDSDIFKMPRLGNSSILLNKVKKNRSFFYGNGNNDII